MIVVLREKEIEALLRVHLDLVKRRIRRHQTKRLIADFDLASVDRRRAASLATVRTRSITFLSSAFSAVIEALSTHGFCRPGDVTPALRGDRFDEGDRVVLDLLVHRLVRLVRRQDRHRVRRADLSSLGHRRDVAASVRNVPAEVAPAPLGET